jgi:pyruvate/2-oxoglutarate/acetoin dehydrogenase E1 component
MRALADAGAVFVGQGVAADGVATFDSLEGVPFEQRIETPVVEELQVGMGIGLALCGFLPVLVYPRMDFLLRAADQLVNHLDKLEEMSRGQFAPRVIIRTRVGSATPLDPGPQHRQNHSAAFRLMLRTVRVIEVTEPLAALHLYRGLAAGVGSSCIVVESL